MKDIKDRQGYPAVFDIMGEIKRGEEEKEEEGKGDQNGRIGSGSGIRGLVENVDRILELKEKGFNIFIGFWEG